MASSTRSSRSGEIPGSRLMARETVLRLTPASAATSRMVGARGQTVCRMHGGSAPQAAAERIAELVARAMDRSEAPIDRASRQRRRAPAACKDILDRVGYKPRERTDMTVAGCLALYLPQRQALE
jgi:hypothetical protein